MALAEHNGVLALGGGAVLDDVRTALATYADGRGSGVPRRLARRGRTTGGLQRVVPLLLGNPRAQWQALMTARRPVYDEVSTLRLVVSRRPRRGRRCAEIAEQLQAEERG